MLESLGGVHGKIVHTRRVEVLSKHFAELIPPNQSILDVGAGDGLLSARIMARRPDLQICGVDVLVRDGSHVPVTQFDGTHLPFADGAFDTVLFSDVLHHTENIVGLLREAVRVARKNVTIKDHTVQGLLARPTLRFMDFVGNAPHGVVLPYNYLTPREWEDAFRTCRMTPQEVRRHLGLYPWWGDLWFGRSLHFIGLYEVS